MLQRLASLRLTLALAAALAGLSIWGSLAIQLRPDAYASIESGILLEWLRATLPTDAAAAWWVVGMVVVAALLALNTIACVVVRLGRTLRSREMPRRAAWALLAHVGFLLVLLGHLLGSAAGFRSNGHRAFFGQDFAVAQRPGWRFYVGKITMERAPEGYPKALEAAVLVRGPQGPLGGGSARINHPVVVDGVALYLVGVEQDLRGWELLPEGGPSVLAEIGRPAALGGGTLTLLEAARLPDGIAVRLTWAAPGRPLREGWVKPLPGVRFQLPDGPSLLWGQIAIDDVGIFDVRCDPGVGLALAGAVVLSASLLPLLRPRRRATGRQTQLSPATSPDLMGDDAERT